MGNYKKTKKCLKLPNRNKVYNFLKKFEAFQQEDENNDFQFVSDVKNTLNLADSLKIEDQLDAKVNHKIKFAIFTRSKFQAKHKN